ncbi:type 2 isopentenyl-diphosphate Delta-isomerase [Ligilactobacillus cholophilus]|uniref:type 2 isopentenyl-diphosphate Delta-isomerase n=1 Tax=Ligilactobacillus cholophilus TaxID=3050131 RepID=UPI0025B15001|nr:type 2 isopentenyl-diphosphate Delta-isomerase [Ligilactobacillus cholophilus]
MNIQEHRKDEHVIIAEKQYHDKSFNQLDQVELMLDNLPEISRDEVSLKTTLMGYQIDSPFFINAITGGSPETDKYNFQLAEAANYCKIPFATGSISVALKNKNCQAGFAKLREITQDTLLFTNLGAGNTLENAQKALKICQADGLQIHLNVAQEIVMPEGDREFYWKDNIEQIVSNLNKPIMIKEVGQGISPTTINKLASIGIQNIDLGAKGGTNFIRIENQRRHDSHDYQYINDLGFSLAQCLLSIKPYTNYISFTASGGIRNPLDIVKALCLGADNVGISGYFLHILIKYGKNELIETIEKFKEEIKDIMVLLGCKNIAELHETKYFLSPELLTFKNQL